MFPRISSRRGIHAAFLQKSDTDWFCGQIRVPTSAKNERDVGHPASCMKHERSSPSLDGPARVVRWTERVMLASLLHARDSSPLPASSAAPALPPVDGGCFDAYRWRRKQPCRSPYCQGHRRAGEDTRHSPGRAGTRRADDCVGNGRGGGNRDHHRVHSGSVPFPPPDRRNRCPLHGRGSRLVTGQQITRLHLRLQCRRNGPGGRLSCRTKRRQRCGPATDPSAWRYLHPGLFSGRPAHSLPVHRRRHPSRRGPGTDETAGRSDRRRRARDPAHCYRRNRLR